MPYERPLIGIPLLRAQIVTWLVWAIFLWLYMYKAVAGSFSGLGDLLIMLGIHITTANLTAFVVVPNVTANWLVGRKVLSVGVVLGFLLAIPLVSIVISMVFGDLRVRTPDMEPKPGILNFWQVFIMLYAGVCFGLIYFGAMAARKGLRAGEARFRELERKLQSVADKHALERLNGQLVPHLINNLMAILHHVVQCRPDKIAFVVHTTTEFTKFYGRYSGNRLVPLQEELGMAEWYLKIIEIRLGYKPFIVIDSPDEISGVGCIPMLLILLVENMKKYAILNDRDNPARITIRIRNGRLHVIATNKKNARAPLFSSSTGLTNLADRLRLLWGDGARLTISGKQASSDTFTIHIVCGTKLFA